MKSLELKILDSNEESASQLIFGKCVNELTLEERVIIGEYLYDYTHPIWKNIPDTNCLISNVGWIRRDDGKIQYFDDIGENKYIHTSFRKKKSLVHRLVAEAFIPNPENKPEVNHINGKKYFNWYKNLEWVTRQENADHASLTGLMRVGVNCKTSKYSEEQVHRVCKMIENGVNYREIARMLDVKHSLIDGIVYGNEWKSISSQYNISKSHRNKKADRATVEAICEKLQDGVRPVDMIREYGFDEHLINTVKYGYAWRDISNNYDIPGLEKVDMKPKEKPIADKIRELLINGVTDTHKIISCLNLQDSKGCRNYVAKVRRMFKRNLELVNN